MKPDVILISPKTSIFTGHLPLGILYLAESLIKHGHKPHIIDENTRDINAELKKALSPDTIAVGISTMSGGQLKSAMRIAGLLRGTRPDLPLVWGGAHVTALPRQTLENRLVDYVIWGEGEQSLPSLLDAIQNSKNPSEIDGIGYKERGHVFITKNSGYTPLDREFNLPYEMLDMDKYTKELIIGVKRVFQVWTSRGCPFSCKFCCNTSRIWPNSTMRYHLISNIVKEVQVLKEKYGADCITFSDENCILNEKRFLEICKALKENRIDVKFRTSGRIDVLSRLRPNTWKAMKNTGFISIGAGVETGSPRMLRYLNKGITLGQIYNVDRKLTKHKLYKTYSAMICLPTETKEDMTKTLRMILNIGKTSIYSPFPLPTLYKYIPLPGTELFHEAVKFGLKPPEHLEGWTEFDCIDIHGTARRVRPWITKDMLRYAEKAIALIEGYNSLFTGESTDKHKVKAKEQEIRKFIRRERNAGQGWHRPESKKLETAQKKRRQGSRKLLR